MSFDLKKLGSYAWWSTPPLIAVFIYLFDSSKSAGPFLWAIALLYAMLWIVLVPARVVSVLVAPALRGFTNVRQERVRAAIGLSSFALGFAALSLALENEDVLEVVRPALPHGYSVVFIDPWFALVVSALSWIWAIFWPTKEAKPPGQSGTE